MRNSIKHLTAVIGLVAGLSLGQFASADLGEAATNPVSNLVQFRLQNQHSWENYNADSWANAAIVQVNDKGVTVHLIFPGHDVGIDLEAAGATVTLK